MIDQAISRATLGKRFTMSQRMKMTFWWWSLSTMLLVCAVQQADAAGSSDLPNCSYPAVYAFGDSLTDTGNGIAAFPDKFALAELDPNGVLFPTHPADRYTDGKLFIDFLAFGVRRRPIYPVLRGTAGDFTYGTNFAAYGGPARTVKVWRNAISDFSTPFGLDVQMQWLQRYKIRLWFYESPVYNPNGRLVQRLPKLAALNASLYVVYAGFQDYAFGLLQRRLSPGQALKAVPSVVKAIAEHLEDMVKVVQYTPPDFDTLDMPPANDILVVNLPPLGCLPALLTIFAGSHEQGNGREFDDHGCLVALNKISDAHNHLLLQTVDALRAKFPARVKLFYGDASAVYTDILKHPAAYNVTAPLKACCGAGGAYNFNEGVRCGHVGMVEGRMANLTASPPCADPAAHLSWDGMHTSNTFNKAMATHFLQGRHISPPGGLQCSPDFTFWNAKT